MRTLRIALAALVMLLLPGFLRAQTATVKADSLVVTWEARPGDQGYHLELTGLGDGELIDLPAGTTRYAWPLWLPQSHAPLAEAIELTACLTRVVRVQLVRPEEGWDELGCPPSHRATVFYRPAQPTSLVRMEIRRGER